MQVFRHSTRLHRDSRAAVRRSVCPEPLEARSLLSVAIDLSLQGAIWAGPDIKVSSADTATVVPFRIDAVRVASPVVTVARIDGVPFQPARIDGVSPVGSAVVSGGRPDILTFAQIDSSSVFFTRPFERDPSAGGDAIKVDRIDSKPLEGLPPKPFEKPSEEVDWTCFEVFKNVAFTFTGGKIEAGLPIGGEIVPVNIVVTQFPQGMVRPEGAGGGIGSFFARIDAFGIFAKPPGSSQGVLVIPPEMPPGTDPALPPSGSVSGGGTVVTPEVPQKVGTDSRPAVRPEGTGGPIGVHLSGHSPTGSEVSRQQLHVAASTSGTVAYPDRHAFSQFEARGLEFVATPKSAAAVGSTEAMWTDPQRPTTLLLDMSASQARNGAGEMARYLAMVAGTQLSSLSEAAMQMFGSGESSPAAGPTIIDLDAIRNGAGSAVALGLSPWHMSANPSQETATAWKVTAGISLVVALGGYWYCKEYTARRRQEQQLLASRFTAGGIALDRDVSPKSPKLKPVDESGRNLIGHISRIWRDEVTY